MADIFISYSHADKAEARELAAYLEAQGYSVWWDTNLKAGDDFQLEIHKEIWPARAAIVLWSKASVKSAWVRAEAAAAQRDNKLIPVKLSDTAYEDIVQPFNLLHTEDFANKELIEAAIQAQLAKPAPAPRFVKQLKYEVLIWFGIIGSAITIFSGLDAIIRMASWASWVSEYWVYWVAEFWNGISHVFSMQLPISYAGPLSVCLFFITAAIGSRALEGCTKSTLTLLTSAEAFAISSIISYVIICIKYRTLNLFSIVDILLYENIDLSALQTIASVIFIFSLTFSIFEVKSLSTSIILSLTYAIISTAILTTLVLNAEAKYGGLQGGGNGVYVLAFAMPATILGAFFISPVAALVRRLISIAIIIGLLLCLSELGKLGYKSI